MWQRGSLLGIFLSILLGSVGCAPRLETAADGDLVFSRDVLPVIRESFVPLLTEETGLETDSWEALMKGSDQGEVVIPFDAERSLLVEVAEGADGPSDDEITLVRQWINAGAPSDAGEIPYADADQLLYVCNQGSAVISVIDMESNLVIRTVDLRDHGFSENANPHHVVVEPDGSHWYVSLVGENTVVRFNRGNEVVGRGTFEVPGMLALDASTGRLYVGRSMTAINPPRRIGIVQLDDMDVEEIDVFFPRPHALVATPDGRYVYSASMGEDQLAGIDTESFDVEIVNLPGQHHMLVQFAVAPDGRTMIAGGEMSGHLLFFDLETQMNPRVVKTLEVGGAPWSPSILPDGSRAFVPRKQADAVSIVDMTSRTEIGVVSGRGFAQPDGSAVRPDGRYVYISNNNLNGGFTPRYHQEGDTHGSVVVIDSESFEIVKVIEVENYPTGIGTRLAN